MTNLEDAVHRLWNGEELSRVDRRDLTCALARLSQVFLDPEMGETLHDRARPQAVAVKSAVDAILAKPFGGRKLDA